MIRHKFNNVPTEIGDARFSSKKEARYYQDLLLAQRAGDLLFHLRQVPFHLPGNVRYIVDFVEFWRDGSVKFVDTKGFRTAMYKVKKKLVEAHFPITITEA